MKSTPVADPRLDSPAAERNAAPIAAELRRLLQGGGGAVIEVGSGTGQHAVAFAGALPHLVWQPTEPEAARRASIAARAADADLANLRDPAEIDVAAEDWPADDALAAVRPARAVFCANVIHIAPWAVAQGLVAGAARLLDPGGLLILYGPFFEQGDAAPSNRAFDHQLRQADPAHGVRELREVRALAEAAGFARPEVTRMPANNLLLSFRRL